MRVRLLDRPVVLQPAHQIDEPDCRLADRRLFAADQRLAADWNRDVERAPDFDAEEARGRDADDVELAAVERDPLSDRRAIAAVARLPEAVRQHRARRR